VSLDLEAQLDRFFHPLQKLIHGTRLGVTPMQRRDARNEITFLIALDHDGELFCHRHTPFGG
jgi:hypothetical protein